MAGDHRPSWAPAETERPLYEGRPFTGVVQRLEESLAEPDLSGKPLPAVAVLDALRLYAYGTSIRQVRKSTGLSFRAARRVHSWVESGAAHWDVEQRKPIVAPGYRLVPGKSPDGPTLQLIRF